MPWIAQARGYWKRRNLNVKFDNTTAGNYILDVQLVQSGRYDAAYLNISQAMVFFDKGVPLRIAAATTAGSAAFMVAPSVNAWSDLKGKKLGVGSLYDTTHLLLAQHVLPAHGIDPSEVQFQQVPLADAPTVLARGDVAGNLLIEPLATVSEKLGAKRMLKTSEIYNNGNFFRNALVLNANFVKSRPDEAAAIVAAHLDALYFMRQKPEESIEIMTAAAKQPRDLVAVALKDSKLGYDRIPLSWMGTMNQDLIKYKVLSKPVPIDQITAYELQANYKHTGPM